MTGLGWPIGGACLPATLMAVRHVNERAGLLDGYNVTYSWADSRVIPALYLFCHLKEKNEPPHGKTNNLQRRKQRRRSASQ